MTPQTVVQARAAFRERHISESYSGPRHLTITVSVSLLIAVSCALMLEGVLPLEWLTIPVTFLYANLSEYLGHKGPMHNRTRLLGLLFERHTLEHHAFFTEEAATYDTTQDFKAVLFPPIMLLFFNGCFTLPAGLLLYWLMSANVALLFVLTATLYFLNYELLHFAYHMDPQSLVGRLPLMERLRKHHTLHHNKQLMAHYNFNITYPICDYVFGTVFRNGGNDSC